MAVRPYGIFERSPPGSVGPPRPDPATRDPARDAPASSQDAPIPGPAEPSSEGALLDALAELRRDAATLRRDLREAKAGLAAARAESDDASQRLAASVHDVHTLEVDLSGTARELDRTSLELAASHRDAAGMLEELVDLRRTAELEQQSGLVARSFEVLLRSQGAAAMLIDSDVRIAHWSDGCTLLWGLARADTIGEPLSALGLGPSTGPALEAAVRACLDGGAGALRITIVHREGRERACDVRLLDVPAGEGDDEPPLALVWLRPAPPGARPPSP